MITLIRINCEQRARELASEAIAVIPVPNVPYSYDLLVRV